MKRLVLGAWCLAFGALSADACTGFYVGRKVSADATTLIGRTVDAAPWNGPMRIARFERGERRYADGTTNDCAFICACMATSLERGFRGGGTINEKGVMLSATVTSRTNDDATKADPYVSVEAGGYGEENLPDYLIGKVASAREAVELLGRMVATHGHAGAEIYMVADTSEAWCVEVYTGHQWAAVKMPDDQVAVFGNQFNIRAFNTKGDDRTVMCSPSLVRCATEHGFAKWVDEGQGIIDLYETYSPPLYDYANYRTWWGHHALAPTAFPEGSYKTETGYPLFFKPETGHRVALTNVFELMRTRYEGVNCPEEKDDSNIRVIGTTKQMSCHVLQMRHALPVDYRCTLWECLAQAEHSTFLPICMAVRGFPDAYVRDQEQSLDYDARRAADAFVRLDTLAEAKRFVVDTFGKRQDVRSFYGDGVRAFWKAQEDRLVAEWPTLLENWRKQAEAVGRAQATAYVNFQQTWSLAEAKRLHDELAWYWAEFNCDLRDGGGATDVPTYPFASSVPTNAELGATWTRWHRTEFDAAVEELAGPKESRSVKVAALVAQSKHVFDGVEDATSLATAKANEEEIVRDICLGRLEAVRIVPGTPVCYGTAEQATNAAENAVLQPSDEVAAVLATDAARRNYAANFGFRVVPADDQWSVEAVLTPTAESNLVENAAAATRQIPVGEIAALETGATKNVTATNCITGFYYTLEGSESLEDWGGSDAYGPSLCNGEGEVEFKAVKKPSDAAGFFTVGAKPTCDVTP